MRLVAMDVFPIVLFLLVWTKMCFAECETSPFGPLHIVFFFADDLGWSDISYHGSPEIPTPNIDLLAKDGIILSKYYVQPLCTPSRAALMTGKYPIRLGLQHFLIEADSPYGLPLDETLLPQYLKSLNYKTHAVGKWHLGFFKEEYTPLRRGFDSHFGYYTGVNDYFTHFTNSEPFTGLDLHDNDRPAWEFNGTYGPDLYTEKAKHIIFKHNSSEPLFLYLAQQAVHSGNYDSYRIQSTGKYVQPLMDIPDCSRRVFGGMVRSMDHSVGELIEALELKGMLDNTLFIFSSDNGGEVDKTRASNYPLRGAKNTYWEGGIRVPAFIWSPFLRSQSRVYSGLMHLVDWLPTLMSAAGGPEAVKKLGAIDGIDHWPSLTQAQACPRSEILINIDPVEEDEAIRKGNYKLIKSKRAGRPIDGWYDIDTNPIKNGIEPVQPAARKELYEENYKRLLKLSKVDRILEQKYGKNSSLQLSCTSTSCKDVLVNCNLPRPVVENCFPNVSACLYDVISDPCEFYNIADSLPDIARDLEQTLNIYRMSMVTPFVNKQDPQADPKLHGNVWVPWR